MHSKSKYILLIILLSLFFYKVDAKYFIENNGQWEDNILFFAQSDDADIWFSIDGIYFDYYKHDNIEFIDNKLSNYNKSGIAIKFELENANFSNTKPIDKANSYFTYITAKNQNNSKNINSYKVLIFENIYSGIDIKFYFIDERLHYDFIVEPNADLNLIKMKFHGMDDLELKANEIKLKSSFIDIYHSNLFAYQIIDGEKIQINAGFSIHNNKIGFYTEEINKSTKLIIDPMIYSTLIGGNDYDIVRDIAVDEHGNSYITGYTNSKNFPTTLGVYQRSFKTTTYDFPDIFVSKFDSTGSNLLFSTFIGSFGDDYAEAIQVNNKGEIYIAGYCWGIGTFPVTKGVYDSLGSEGYDIFSLKLSADGSQLIYSTLIAGKKDDFANDLAIDEFGNAYIVGYVSHDSQFPLTAGAYKSTNTGKYDAVVMKLNADASKLLYSSHLSGIADDFGQSIHIDHEKNAYIVGITRSANFPTTSTAFQKTYSDTSETDRYSDVFITKINPSGSAILYSTFLGGISKDAGYGITLDRDQNIIVCGFTESLDFPTTPNVWDNLLNDGDVNTGIGDIFVTKISPDFSKLIFSTYIGGAGSELGNDIDLDNEGYMYIVGATNSDNFPVTRKAFQKARKDTNLFTDAFLVKLNPNATKVTYSTYLGGTGNDIAFALNYFDGTAILTGRTNSADFPVSALSYDETYNDSLKSDVFVARIKPNALEIDAGGASITICNGESVILGNPVYGGTGKLTYSWTPPYFLGSTNQEKVISTPDSSITYTFTVADEAGNVEIDTVRVIVNPTPTASISGNFLSKKDLIDTYYAPKNPNYKYFWNIQGGIIQSLNNQDSIVVKWADTLFGIVKLVVYNELMCRDSASLNIVLNYKHNPKLSYSGLPIFCEGDSLVLDAGPGFVYYSWSDGKTTRTNTIKKTGKYFVVVVDADGFGGVSDTVNVIVNSRPQVNVSGNTKCAFNTIEKYKSEFQPNYIYRWSVLNGQILNGQGTNEITVEWGTNINCKVILTVENALNCKTVNELIVKVGAFGNPKITINPKNQTYCTGDTVLLDAGIGYGLYVWNTGETNQTIRVTKSGKYWLRAIDAEGIVRNSDTVTIEFLPSPPKPTIIFFNGYVRCLEAGDSYIWYLNDSILKSETSRQFKPTENGYYRVALKGANGCYAISDSLLVIVKSVEENNNSIKIYPNPSKDYFTFLNNNQDLLIIEISDVLGNKVFDAIIEEKIFTIDFSKYSSGIYIATIQINGKNHYYKLLKTE